ncbi:MAG: hypothetical protein ACRD2D_08885, partial [Terriglobales bacterium]
PLALALPYFWEQAYTTTMNNLWFPARVLSGLAGLRLFGCGFYSRRLLQRAGGNPPPGGASARLTEMGSQALLIVLWMLTLPVLLGICLLYTAAQYAPLTGEEGLRAALRPAWRWWTGEWAQGWLALLFAAVLLVNFLALALLLPMLAHTFFGASGALTRAAAGGSMLDDPLLWASLAVAVYLALDPVFKCVMVLSYHRLASVDSGADLRQRVRELCQAKSAAPAVAVAAVAPEALRQALRSEFQRPVYAWHSAHPQPLWPWLDRRLNWILSPILTGLRWLGHETKLLIEWLIRELFGRSHGAASGSYGRGWEALVWTIAAAALVLLVLIWLRRRHATAVAGILAPGLARRLDVAQAHAGEAAADTWFEEAARLEQAGDFRLAVRAAFLGGLAGLGDRRLLTLRRDRTNLEYCNELRRRTAPRAAQSATPLLTHFAAAMGDFNAVWYGAHAVDGERCRRFIAGQKELLADA